MLRNVCRLAAVFPLLLVTSAAGAFADADRARPGTSAHKTTSAAGHHETPCVIERHATSGSPGQDEGPSVIVTNRARKGAVEAPRPGMGVSLSATGVAPRSGFSFQVIATASGYKCWLQR